jgi:hypothetical protein
MYIVLFRIILFNNKAYKTLNIFSLNIDKSLMN